MERRGSRTPSFNAMPRRKSSVVGREFGEGVRRAIEQTRLTHRKLAEELGWDEAKLSDLVRGKGGVDEGDLKQLLGYCRVPPAEVRHLLALFHETRENGYLKIPEDGLPGQVRRPGRPGTPRQRDHRLVDESDPRPTPDR